MKKIAVLISALLIAGCGQNDPGLAKKMGTTDKQRAEIAVRLTPFGVVNLSAEPENFNGPVSAYVVNGEALQVAAVDALPGKAKYAGCLACHGANGEGGIGPMLAGQTVDYIVGRLTAYRNGEQVGAQSALMWGQASGLSDQDIQDLAKYVESL